MKLNLKWRGLALLAVILFALSMLALLRLLLNNILIAGAVGLTSLLLVYTAWLVFTGTGKRFRRGVIAMTMAALALVIELIVFLSQSGNGRYLLSSLILIVLYLALFSVLRDQYWRQIRLAKLISTKIKFKHPYLIINPKSGSGRALKAGTSKVAAQMGIKVLELSPGTSMQQLAEQAIKAGADVLGVSGGDGSIGSIAAVAIKHRLPMVVLPGGTRCHFARDIGLDPKKINDALSAFYGVKRKIDVGQINGRIFMNNVSFGVYADIVSHPEYRDNKLAVTRKVLQDIMAGAKKPYSLKLKRVGLEINEVVMILIGVNRYNTINLTEIGQRSKMDQGILQINLISKLNDQLVQKLLQRASLAQLAKNTDLNGFSQWDDKSISINNNNQEITVGVDGENEKFATPVKVECLPGALEIYVPPEGERARPASGYSLRSVKKLWGAFRGQ